MEGKQVLIIDDDSQAANLLKMIFESAQATVTTATSGAEGLRLLWQIRPDLIILDVMMPDLNGWDICRRIRELSDVPIIVVSVLRGDEDIVHGFSLGADDYVSKPVQPAVLLARAEALLRRTREQPGEPVFDDGYLRVDLEAQRVEVAGGMVRLTPTEYALLSLLVRRAGRVVPMDLIQQEVWGGTDQVSAPTVHVFISQLRKKIEPNPGEPCYIVSEYGMGYRFP